MTNVTESAAAGVYFQILNDGTFDLDVRESLLAGGSPLRSILEYVTRLEAGDRLRLHALFEPVPLIRKLGRMGYAVECEHAGPDHWLLHVRTQE